MRGPSNSYPKRAAVGIGASLLIGIAVVATCNLVWAVAGHFPIASAWDEASPTQVLIAAFPFLILALCGVGARRPWVVGLVMTGAFWGYYLWDITHYRGGGANIGLGILMMFSPIPITGACLLALLTLADGRRADDIATGR